MFFWLQFSISGAKFTRYTMFVLPAVYTTAAIGAYYVIRWVARRIAELVGRQGLRVYLKAALASLMVIFSLMASAERFLTSACSQICWVVEWAAAALIFPRTNSMTAK